MFPIFNHDILKLFPAMVGRNKHDLFNFLKNIKTKLVNTFDEIINLVDDKIIPDDFKYDFSMLIGKIGISYIQAHLKWWEGNIIMNVHYLDEQVKIKQRIYANHLSEVLEQFNETIRIMDEIHEGRDIFASPFTLLYIKVLSKTIRIASLISHITKDNTLADVLDSIEIKINSIEAVNFQNFLSDFYLAKITLTSYSGQIDEELLSECNNYLENIPLWKAPNFNLKVNILHYDAIIHGNHPQLELSELSQYLMGREIIHELTEFQNVIQEMKSILVDLIYRNRIALFDINTYNFSEWVIPLQWIFYVDDSIVDFIEVLNPYDGGFFHTIVNYKSKKCTFTSLTNNLKLS